MEVREIVLITGITGYIGSWVAKYFFGEDNFNDIEFVEASLSNH